MNPNVDVYTLVAFVMGTTIGYCIGAWMTQRRRWKESDRRLSDLGRQHRKARGGDWIETSHGFHQRCRQ